MLHETTERITQELIDSRVMGLVWCGCERAVILKDLVRCILVARVVRDDAGAACVQQWLSWFVLVQPVINLLSDLPIGLL